MEQGQQMDQVTDRDRYTATIQMIVGGDNVSWNRFSSFVTFAAALVAGWLVLHTQTQRPQYATAIETVLSGLGLLAGLAWAAQGYRGRRFVHTYVDLAKQLEQRGAPSPDGKAALNPATATVELRDSMKFSKAGSFYILTVVPLLASVLFAGMLVVSFFPSTEIKPKADAPQAGTDTTLSVVTAPAPTLTSVTTTTMPAAVTARPKGLGVQPAPADK